MIVLTVLPVDASSDAQSAVSVGTLAKSMAFKHLVTSRRPFELNPATRTGPWRLERYWAVLGWRAGAYHRPLMLATSAWN